MINETQANNLCELILDYASAYEQKCHVGQLGPTKQAQADAAFEKAEDELWALIDGVTRKSTPSRTKKSSPSSKKGPTPSARKRRN